MFQNIKKILKKINTKWSFFTIYLILVILSGFRFPFKIHFVSYIAFSLVLGLIFFFVKKSKKKLKFPTYLLLLPLVLVLVSRLLPFFKSPDPLLYDIGLYRGTFIRYFSNLPQIPFFMPGSHVAAEFRGLYILADVLHLLGFSVDQILYGFYIFIQVLLGLVIYITAKEFFNKNVGILATFLYSFSILQIDAFHYAIYKNILGLILLLVSLYLLKRKSYLAIFSIAFLSAVHLPTTFIFVVILFIYFIFAREKIYILLIGITSLILSSSFIKANFYKIKQTVFVNLKFYGELVVHKFSAFILKLRGVMPEEIKPLPLVKPQVADILQGRFVPFPEYLVLAAIFLPLAFLGFLYLLRKKKWNYLCIGFALVATLVLFKFIFYRRLLVHLDIFAILLGGLGCYFIVQRLWPNFLGKLVLIAVFVSTSFFILYWSYKVYPPMILPEDMAEIKELQKVEDDAYILSTTTLYAASLYGWSGHSVIAPGLFEHSKYTEKEWKIFWSTSDRDIRYRLLNRYQRPIYVYVGESGFGKILDQDPAFSRWSPKVYRYLRQ